MNTAPPTSSADVTRFSLNEKRADRLGVAASVLCAIHCALAPVLLIFLPTFGEIWAHPASHILVALFIVPLAAFSIWKGYRTHRKRWIIISASIGIFLVLGGAALPAFTKNPIQNHQAVAPEPAAELEEPAASCGSCETDSESSEASCGGCAAEGAEAAEAGSTMEATTVGCVDNCCPSIQVSESGETSLHVPPAAIVTTLGGCFLIAAHIGNLRSGSCGCGVDKCKTF